MYIMFELEGMGGLQTGKLFIELLVTGLFQAQVVSITTPFMPKYLSRLIVLSRSYNLLHPLCFILCMLEAHVSLCKLHTSVKGLGISH